jgi:hypothetical protein
MSVLEVHAMHRSLVKYEGPDAAAAMLTTQIQLRADWADIRDILVLLGGHLNHIHVVLLLCRLAKVVRAQPDLWVRGSDGNPTLASANHPQLALLVRELAERVKDGLPDADPGDPGAIAGATGALALLCHYDPELVSDVQRRSVAWMASLAPHHMVALLWAMAWFHKHHRHPPDDRWLGVATSSIGARLPSLSAAHLARTLYALALLRHRPAGEWMQPFLAAFTAAVPAFRGQDLSNSLYALAILQVQPPPGMLRALGARVKQQLHALQPQQLGTIVWAWGRLRDEPGVSLLNAVMHWSSLQLPQFEVQHLANLLWGLTVLRAPMSKGFQGRFLRVLVQEHILPHQRAGGPGCHPRAFCCILYSLAVLGLRPPNRWLGAYFQWTAHQLPEFTPRGLATTAWALGELGYLPNDEWMFDFGREVQVALPRCRPVDLAQLLCGFRGLKRDFKYQLNSSLLRLLVQTSVAKLPAFSANQTAALLSACCCLYLKPSMRTMLAAFAHFDRQLHLANAHAVSNAVWALGRLGSRSVDRSVVMAQAELVARLLAASLASLPHCNSLDLVQQLVGWSELHHHPGADWMQQHEQRCYAQLVQAAQLAPSAALAAAAPAAADAAASGGRHTPGFTKSEAEKLHVAYVQLGHDVQHPVLQRMVQAAALQMASGQAPAGLQQAAGTQQAAGKQLAAGTQQAAGKQQAAGGSLSLPGHRSGGGEAPGSPGGDQRVRS